MNEEQELNQLYVDLAAEIVSAYVSNNSVSPTDLVSLIDTVHTALRQSNGAGVAAAEVIELKPAVPVKKSITPDFLICLEDGRKFKSLKRHLQAKYGLTPDQYRTKWDLPRDYPMVAPNYSQARSQLAQTLGLGRKPAPAPEPVKAPVRRRKAKTA